MQYILYLVSDIFFFYNQGLGRFFQLQDIKDEIEKYVSYFVKKKKLKFNSKKEIDQVLTSQKYFEFVDKVYNFYNSQISTNVDPKERLSIECYYDVDQAINSFWNRLLGNKFSEKIKTILKLG